MFLAFVLGALGQHGVAKAPKDEDPWRVREFRVAGSVVTVRMPASWHDDGVSSTRSTIVLASNRIRVDVSVLPTFAAGESESAREHRVLALTKQGGEKALGQAREQKLKITPLQGAMGAGYYFDALEDKAPRAGEHPFMSQGAVLCGPSLVTFTILLRDTNDRAMIRALEVISSIRVGPGQ